MWCKNFWVSRQFHSPFKIIIKPRFVQKYSGNENFLSHSRYIRGKLVVKKSWKHSKDNKRPKIKMTVGLTRGTVQ